MSEVLADLEKPDIQGTTEVHIKPVVKAPTKILLSLLLIGLVGAISYGISNRLKSDAVAEKFQVENAQISEPVATPIETVNVSAKATEPETSEGDDIDGRQHSLIDKTSALHLLSEEVQEQLNNHFLSTRNFYLRKSYDQITKKGRNYEYYLLQDLKRIKKEFDSELLKNNEQSISGVGGEFGASASQRNRVRSLYGDLMGLILALDYIYSLPDEAIPDADALTSRVSTGVTSNHLITLEMEITRSISTDLENHMAKVRERQKEAKALNELKPEVVEGLKNEIKSGNQK